MAVAEPIYDRLTGVGRSGAGRSDDAGSGPPGGASEQGAASPTAAIPVPESRIPVVVFGRTDQANGYFTSAPQSHIGIFVAPPTGYWLGLRNDSWLETVFLHELVHFLHIRWSDGFFFHLSSVLGPAALAPLSGFYRGWAIEGPAVFLETALAPGGRGTNPFFEMYAKALVYENAFFDLDRAGYSSLNPPPGRIYLAGYLVTDYIVDTYGLGALVGIQERIAANPLLGLDRAIKEVTGYAAAEIYTQMLDRLEEHYGPETVGAVDSSAPQPITGGGRAADRQGANDGPAPGARNDVQAANPPGIGNYSLPVATDAGLITYRTRADSPPAIVVIDPYGPAGDYSGSPEERVLLEVALSDQDSFTASQDGSTVVFTAYVGREADPTGRALHSALYTYDLESGEPPRRIGSESGFLHPQLDAGGRLFALKRRGAYRDFVEVDRGTGQSRVVVRAEGMLFFHPTISPDGRTALIVGQSPGVQQLYEVYLAQGPATEPPAAIRATAIRATATRTSGAGARGAETPAGMVELLPPGVTPYYPRFQQDGTIWFSSDVTGELAVYSYDKANKHLAPVVRDAVGAYAALHLPGTESALVYAAYRVEGRRLFAAEPLDADAGQEASRNDVAEAGRHAEPVGLVTVGPVEDAASFIRQPTTLSPLPYLDLPVPRLWFPRPDLLFLSQEPADWYPGIGLGVMGWGLLPSTNLSMEAIVYPQIGQMVGGIDLSLGTQSLRFSYGLDQSYDRSGSRYVQSTSQRVGLNAVVGGGSRYWGAETTRAGFSFGHQYLRSTAGVGSFFESDPGDPATENHFLTFGAALRHARTSLSAPDELFSRLSGFVEAGASAALPLSSGGKLSVVPRLESSITVPGPARLHTIRLSAEVDYAFGPVPTTRSVSPRGFDDLFRAHRGSLLGSLDYSISFGAMDVPLGQSTGLLNLGTVVHATALADWNTNGLVVNSRLYTGIDLVARLGVAGGSTDTGMGFASEIDVNEPRITGIAVYAFLGSSSYDNTLVSLVFRW